MMARIGLEADATPEQAEVFLNKISELLEKLTDRRKSSKPDSRHRPRCRRVRARRDGHWLLVSLPTSIDRPAERARQSTGTARCEMHRPTPGKLHTLFNNGSAKGEVSTRPRLSTRKRGFAWNGSVDEARCTNFDDLPEAERRSQNLVRLEEARATCEEQLMAAAAGAELMTVLSASRSKPIPARWTHRSMSSRQRSQPRKKS